MTTTTVLFDSTNTSYRDMPGYKQSKGFFKHCTIISDLQLFVDTMTQKKLPMDIVKYIVKMIDEKELLIQFLYPFADVKFIRKCGKKSICTLECPMTQHVAHRHRTTKLTWFESDNSIMISCFCNELKSIFLYDDDPLFHHCKAIIDKQEGFQIINNGSKYVVVKERKIKDVLCCQNTKYFSHQAL